MERVIKKIQLAKAYFEMQYPELKGRKITFTELITLAAEYAQFKETERVLTPKN